MIKLFKVPEIWCATDRQTEKWIYKKVGAPPKK